MPDDEYLGLVVEHSRMDISGELQTEVKVLPFFLSTEEALDSIDGRKGNSLHGRKKRTTQLVAAPILARARLTVGAIGLEPKAESAQPRTDVNRASKRDLLLTTSAGNI